MPAYFKCPMCHEDATFGFVPVNGGVNFYHTRKGGQTCSYYSAGKGRIFPTHLALFEAVVVPRTPKSTANKFWIEARRADLTGHPRKAKLLYAKWNKAEGIR